MKSTNRKLAKKQNNRDTVPSIVNEVNRSKSRKVFDDNSAFNSDLDVDEVTTVESEPTRTNNDVSNCDEDDESPEVVSSSSNHVKMLRELHEQMMMQPSQKLKKRKKNTRLELNSVITDTIIDDELDVKFLDDISNIQEEKKVLDDLDNLRRKNTKATLSSSATAANKNKKLFNAKKV